MKPAEKAGLLLMILSAPGVQDGNERRLAALILFLFANALFMFGGSIGEPTKE